MHSSDVGQQEDEACGYGFSSLLLTTGFDVLLQGNLVAEAPVSRSEVETTLNPKP